MRQSVSSVCLGLTVLSLVSVYGCAVPKGTQAETPRIEPVYRVSSSPQTVSAIYQTGRHELGQGRYEAALGQFRQVLQLDPESVDAMNGMAVAHANLGQTEDALRWFAEAIRRSPDLGYLRANHGRLLMKAGRLDDAERELQQARSLFGALNAQADASLLELQSALALRGAAPPASAVAAAGTVGRSTAEVGAVPAAAAPRAAAPQAAAPAAAPAPTFEVNPSSPAALTRVAPGIYELGLAPAAARSVAPGNPSERVARPATAPVASTPASAAMPGPSRSDLRPPSMATAVPTESARAAPVRIEVSNGNGVTGMAARTAKSLRTRDGLAVSRITNYTSFAMPKTEVHYRAGDERAAATLLSELPADVALVAATNLRVGVDVRLVLGRDGAARRIADGTRPALAPVLAMGDSSVR
jgi:thioredoxin-like negative regulator of GroEL